METTVFGKTIRERAEEVSKKKNSKHATLSILAHAWVAVQCYPIGTSFLSKRDAKLATELIAAKIQRIQNYVQEN